MQDEEERRTLNVQRRTSNFRKFRMKNAECRMGKNAEFYPIHSKFNVQRSMFRNPKLLNS